MDLGDTHVNFDHFVQLMLQLRSFWHRWAASMRCVLLPGGVFRGTAIRDFEAESVSGVKRA